MMSKALAELKHVSRVYQKGKDKVEVLHELDLEIPVGDFAAIMGPSGSGKTTLLNLLGGLDRPSSGTVTVGGAELSSMSNSQLSKWRDEPTGDLDRETADDILGLLQILNRNHGKTIVMVTHDAQAAGFARRTLHVDKGKLEVRAAA